MKINSMVLHDSSLSGTSPEGGVPLPPRRLGDNILAPVAAVEAPRIWGSEGVKEGVRMGAS